MNTDEGRPPEVLVVDDELLGRRLIRQHVSIMGCVVRECPGGEEAIASAFARPPDVALVDVEMPGLNGLEVCRRLTGDPRTADTPVIVVTARAGIEDLEAGFEAGATDYIRKPFNPRELVARVRTAIELKRRGDSLRHWKERLSNDLAVAGALQRTIFPQRPHVSERLRVYPVTRSSIEVGGDFFDAVPLADGRIAVCVGDVAGHGVGPAMAAILLKTSLGEILRDHAAAGPARVANELHRVFRQQIAMPNLYATMLLCLIDPARRTWRCLSCGHPPPILPGGRDAEALFGERGGPPLGFALAPDVPYSERDEVLLEMGGCGVGLLVTDGLIEAVPGDADSGRRVLVGLLDEWTTSPDLRSASEYVFQRLLEMGLPIDRDDCTALAVDHVCDCETLLASAGLRPATELADLARQVESAVTQAGGSDSLAWALQLVVLEHGANAIRHGAADTAASVAVHLCRRRGRIELLMRDAGRPWDVAAAPQMAAQDSADHGRGIAMIRRIAPRVEYNLAAGQNVTLFTVPWGWEMADE